MNDNFDKEFGKEVAKAVVMAMLTTAATQLVLWAFEKIRGKKEDETEDDEQ